jgi:hypothetical protein
MSDEVGQEVTSVEGETKRNKNPEKTSSNFSYLKVLLLAAIPFAGYIVGNSYHQTYLDSFGINADAFPLSVQDIYVRTFESLTLFSHETTISVTKITSKLSLFLTLEFLSIILLIYIGAVAWAILVIGSGKITTSSENGANTVTTNKSNWFIFTSSLVLGLPLTVAVVALIIAIPMMLFITLILVYMLGSSQAQDVAQGIITDYKKHGCEVANNTKQWKPCTQLNDSKGKEIYKGILIVQNDKRVAFYNGKESVILEIPTGAVIKNVVNPDYKATL